MSTHLPKLYWYPKSGCFIPYTDEARLWLARYAYTARKFSDALTPLYPAEHIIAHVVSGILLSHSPLFDIARPVDDAWREKYDPALGALIERLQPKYVRKSNGHIVCVGGTAAIDRYIRLFRYRTILQDASNDLGLRIYDDTDKWGLGGNIWQLREGRYGKPSEDGFRLPSTDSYKKGEWVA
jgi:hypothetical protein